MVYILQLQNVHVQYIRHYDVLLLVVYKDSFLHNDMDITYLYSITVVYEDIPGVLVIQTT